jgi:hypothetical protein
VFFREILIDRFRFGFGDDGDGRFVVFISNQWWDLGFKRIINGQGLFFHPQEYVLGYSDLLIGFSPIRIISEVLNINLFTSLILFVSLLSFLSFVGIMKYVKIFQNQQLNNFQLLVISIACFGSGLSVSASTHPQLFMIYLYPWVLYFFEKAKLNKKSSFYLGMLLGLILISSIYIFIFSVISIVFLYLIQFRYFKHNFFLSSLYLVIGLSVTGFYAFFIYLKTYLVLGPRSREDLIGDIPPIFNVFNYGESNLLWGNLVQQFVPFFGNGAGDNNYAIAVTPVLTIVCISFLIIFRKDAQSLALFLLGSFMILLTVQIRGISLWAILSYVPGFDVIRSIGRVQLVSHFLICIALAILLAQINKIRTLGYILALGLVSLIFIENVSFGLITGVDLRKQEILVNLGEQIPEGCESFFAIAGDFERPNFAYQVDSMIVAMGAKIPTLNGYSGNQPKDWEVNNIQFPDYADRIKNWINQKNINETICQIDLDKKTWSIFKY